jgi:hypothetical protein
MDDLILRLRQRIKIAPTTDLQQSPAIVPRPCLSQETIKRFEDESGLRVPVLLRRIYTEVGNGGFGPAWGINELDNDDENSIGGWSRIERRELPDGLPSGWPNPLLRICDIGCNAYFGLASGDDRLCIYIVDPLQGTDDPVSWLLPQEKSLYNWLIEWVSKPIP